MPTATVAAGRPMRLPRPWPAMWSIWLAPGTQGPTTPHLSVLLSEREGIDIGRTTLRRILVKAGLNSPRLRLPPKHRVRRQRMPREGMLIQLDGSYYPWLGDQAPPFTLLIAVDDATGAVVGALFCEKEEAFTYFLLSRIWRRALAFLWPYTSTGTGSSFTQRGPVSPEWRPSSAGPWMSWEYR